MGAATPRFSIEVEVIRNGLPDLDRRLQAAQGEIAREVARAYLGAVQENVLTGRVPGPPLSQATIEEEARRLQRAGQPTDNASKPWRMFDEAVLRAEILTRQTPNGQGVAEIIPPTQPTAEGEDRPAGIYELLEYGGVNAAGHVVPERPVWRHTLNETLERLGRTAAEVVKRRLI